MRILQLEHKGATSLSDMMYKLQNYYSCFYIISKTVERDRIALLVLFFKAFFGKIKLYSSVPVEVAATYWHFVDILWIYLLVFFMVIG